MIYPSASISLKAAFYAAIQELDISNTELAIVLGVDEKEVRRLIDPRHPSKLGRIERLMRQLGQRITVGVEPSSAPAKISKEDLETRV